MTTNNKGCAVQSVAALNIPERRDYIRSAVKTLIVNLALWRVIPGRLATWLIQRGGLKHA